MPIALTPGLQTNVLALIIQEPSILERHRSAFTERFFENQVCRNIGKLVFDFFDEHEGIPSRDTLMALAENFLLDKEDQKPYQLDYVVNIERLYSDLPDADKKYIRKNLEEILKQQAINSSIYRAADLANEGKYDKIVDVIEKATLFTFEPETSSLSWESLGHFDYLDNPEKPPVPTGFRYLDRDMHGGLRPSEFGIVMAGTGVGKSQALLNIAKGAMDDDRKVLYVTLELSMRQAARRMDSLVSETDYWALGEPFIYDRAKMELRRYISEHPRSRFRIKFWPMGSVTVRQLHAYYKRMINEEEVPDVVLIDYGDLFASSHKYGDKYDELGHIFMELKGFAQTWDVPTWTVTQGNRSTMDARNTGLKNLAESFKKAFVADAILTTSMTPDEHKRHLFRMFSAKMRSHGSGREYYFRQFFEYSKMENITPSQYHVLSNSTEIAELREQIELKGMLNLND